MINPGKLKRGIKALSGIMALIFFAGYTQASVGNRLHFVKQYAFKADTAQTDTTIYTKPYTYPAYPGGGNALVIFIENKMKYPREMAERRIEGKVMVQCVVEKDGKLTNIKVLKSLGYGSAEEAIRLVKALPKWKPGTNLAGETVRVAQQIPVVFILNKKEVKPGFQISTY